MDEVAASALTTGSRYAYHVTPQDDVESILTHGLDPTQSDNRFSELDTFLSEVAAQLDVSDTPAQRAECVFLYPSKKRAKHITENLSGMCALTIDVQQVPHDVFLADYSEATAVVQELEQNPDLGVDETTTAFEAAQSYWESMTKYTRLRSTSWSDELLVDGAVPSCAIIEYAEE